MTVSSGGDTITGNSSITGTLSTGALTVSSGILSVSSGNATISGTLAVTGGFTGSFVYNNITSRNLTIADLDGPLISTNAGATNQMGMSMSGDYTTGSYKDGSTRVWIKLFGGGSGNNRTCTITANVINGGCQITQGSTSWVAVSDERLKDITGTYDNAWLDTIKIKSLWVEQAT